MREGTGNIPLSKRQSIPQAQRKNVQRLNSGEETIPAAAKQGLTSEIKKGKREKHSTQRR
jgi:hypothetical protein